jgi:hypothetical protein
MVLFVTLRRSGGIEAIARHLAIPSADAHEAVTALIAPVVAAYQRMYLAQGRGRAAIAEMIEALAGFGGGRMAVDVMMPGAVDVASAEGLLILLFGSAEHAWSIAQMSADKAAMDEPLLVRVLPLLAMLIGGYLCARADAFPHSDGLGEPDVALVAEFEALLEPS